MLKEVKGSNEKNEILVLTKLKFFMLVWKDGAFESEIISKLHVNWRDALDKELKLFKFERFLSVDSVKNLKADREENFYSISKENIRFMLKRICKSAQINFDEKIFNFIINDSKNIVPEMIDNLDDKLNFSMKLNRKELMYMLDNSTSYFLLYLMNLSPSISQIQRNKENNEILYFFNNVFTRLETKLLTEFNPNMNEIQNNTSDNDFVSSNNKISGLQTELKYSQSDYIFNTITAVFLLSIIYLLSRIATGNILQISLTNIVLGQIVIDLPVLCAIGMLIFPLFYTIQYFLEKYPNDELVLKAHESSFILVLVWIVFFIFYILVNIVSIPL